MRARFIDIDGVRTRYLYEGEGNATKLLLIHAGGVSADTWLRNIDVLGQDFAVYAPDNLGHGFTDAVDLGPDLPQARSVAHLGGFMDRLGLERCAVGGSSYGSLVSALLYLERPTQVEKLILIGSSSTFDTDEDNKEAIKGAFANSAKALGSPTPEVCRKRLANAVYDPASVPDELVFMQLTQYAQPDRLTYYEHAMRKRIAWQGPMPCRVAERLDEIRAPTLILTGKQDKRTDWRTAEEAAKRMPNAVAHSIDKCGHLPYLEYPDLFNRLVAEFLRS